MATPREVVDEFAERSAKKDPQGMAELMADDIVIHFPGRSPVAGDHKGKEAFFAAYGKLQELSAGTLTTEPHDIVGSDDHAVALVTIRAERGGDKIEFREAGIFHVRDGKVTEIWLLIEDLYRFDEFWS